MALHGTDGVGVYCGQPGEQLCSVSWEKFRRMMADRRYSEVLCQKCKRWVRKALLDHPRERGEGPAGAGEQNEKAHRSG